MHFLGHRNWRGGRQQQWRPRKKTPHHGFAAVHRAGMSIDTGCARALCAGAACRQATFRRTRIPRGLRRPRPAPSPCAASRLPRHPECLEPGRCIRDERPPRAHIPHGSTRIRGTWRLSAPRSSLGARTGGFGIPGPAAATRKAVNVARSLERRGAAVCPTGAIY